MKRRSKKLEVSKSAGATRPKQYLSTISNRSRASDRSRFPQFVVDHDVLLLSQLLALNVPPEEQISTKILLFNPYLRAFNEHLELIKEYGAFDGSFDVWRQSYIPIIEEIDDPKIVLIKHDVEVIAVAQSNGFMYFNCEHYTGSISCSIQKLDLSNLNVGPKIIYSEEIESLHGLLVYDKVIFTVHDRDSLFLIDVDSPEHNRVQLPLFEKSMKCKRLHPKVSEFF